MILILTPRRTIAGMTALVVSLVALGCRSAAPATSAPAAGIAAPATAAEQVPVGSAKAQPAPEAPYRNTIRWSTSSEVDSFGFDVFRGESEAGPFERLNAKPIAGAGTSDENHSYVYVDETIDPTKAYYYYVESISIDGVREKFTPVSRAGAKIAQPTPDTP